jgi:CBS-domain-containing membrane protein
MNAETDTAVADSMHTFPKTSHPSTTVGQARELFGNDKVHALLVVDDGVLIAVVERADLTGRDDHEPVAPAGRLGDRVVAPSDGLHETWDAMVAAGRRRVAVTTEGGRLVGLLCLKRSGLGFCSDAGIRARAEERAAGTSATDRAPDRPPPQSMSSRRIPPE